MPPLTEQQQKARAEVERNYPDAEQYYGHLQQFLVSLRNLQARNQRKQLDKFDKQYLTEAPEKMKKRMQELGLPLPDDGTMYDDAEPISPFGLRE